jgi:hypothetical protein
VRTVSWHPKDPVISATSHSGAINIYSLKLAEDKKDSWSNHSNVEKPEIV